MSEGHKTQDTRPRPHAVAGLGAILAALGTLAAASPAQAQTVGDIAARGRCSTAGVEGISEQLVRQHMCMQPDAFVPFTPHPGISLSSSRVHPYATPRSRDALHAAAERISLTVNSAFRPISEQYVLRGGCPVAAEPGSSNHQTGLAVDLANWDAALDAMRGAGCSHPLPSRDPVHFDCPGPDMRSGSVLAFQRLWNINHPEDAIAEDGVYGPQTDSRLGRAPADGFPMDGCEPVLAAAYVEQSFPVAAEPAIELAAGESIEGFIELRNVGGRNWDERTHLATTEPRDRDSPFAAPEWPSASRPAVVEGTVEPDESFRFELRLVAPDEPGEYREFFGLIHEGEAWFSDPGQGGPPDDQLQVRLKVVEAVETGDAGTGPADAGGEGEPPVRGDAGTGDGGMRHSPPASGCSAAAPVPSAPRGSGGLAMGLLALMLRDRTRRRRRRRT